MAGRAIFVHLNRHADVSTSASVLDHCRLWAIRGEDKLSVAARVYVSVVSAHVANVLSSEVQRVLCGVPEASGACVVEM